MIVQCSNCGSEIQRQPSKVDKNTTGLFFCSMRCKSAYFREGYLVECVVCGSQFEKKPAEQSRHPVHCCSAECRNVYVTKSVQISCDGCGTEITRPPCKLDGRSFCSKGCFDKFQTLKEPVTCWQCGVVFEKQKCLIDRSYSNFCSNDCRSKYRFRENFVESEFGRMLTEEGIPFTRNDRTVLSDDKDKRRCPELDFYFPDLGYAVEINGRAHYDPIYGDEALASQKVRDSFKRRRCKELGITLRVVKPGNCRKGVYIARFNRVIWEIKRILNETNR